MTVAPPKDPFESAQPTKAAIARQILARRDLVLSVQVLQVGGSNRIRPPRPSLFR